jgi:hypothetical protein
MHWRPKSRASRPTSSLRRVTPLERGTARRVTRA